jgi:D-3-phosphoglycerate dehydrogenase
MTYKVAVIDTFYSSDLSVLKSGLKEHKIEVDVYHPEMKDFTKLNNYDVIVIQHLDFGRKRAHEHLDPNRCKLVLRAGVGYDELDLPALTELGIPAVNVPGYGPNSVGQHTLQYILDLAGHANEYHHRMVTTRDLDLGKEQSGEDKWVSQSRIPSTPLYKSVLGILGYGRIGKKAAELSQPLFKEILACDPYLDDEVFRKGNVTRVELDELLETADFVSVHVPLFEKRERVYLGYENNYQRTEMFYEPTVGLIDKEQIAKMKDGAFLINAARGPIVKESAVIKALESGKLGGVAMDVFEQEPLRRDHPLRKMAAADLPAGQPLRKTGQEKYNIVLTCHSAYLLRGTFNTVLELSAEEIVRVLINEELPHNLVNPEVLQGSGLHA